MITNIIWLKEALILKPSLVWNSACNPGCPRTPVAAPDARITGWTAKPGVNKPLVEYSYVHSFTPFAFHKQSWRGAIETK